MNKPELDTFLKSIGLLIANNHIEEVLEIIEQQVNDPNYSRLVQIAKYGEQNKGRDSAPSQN